MVPIIGSKTHHTKNEPAQIIAAYFNPMIYPKPRTAAEVLIEKTSLHFSAKVAPHVVICVDNCSVHKPKVDTTKSYNPPIPAAQMRGLAEEVAEVELLSASFSSFSLEIRTCVVAVASGNGYSPCFSFTK